MDLNRLKTFRTVAVLQNFNRAAEILHYAQSTVSAQIKALEDEVGVLLFERVGRQAVLTEAGQTMLNYAHKLLAIEEEALSEVTGRRDSAGLLTIRAPQTVSTYYLPRVLADFRTNYPRVRLDISSCAYYSLEHELQIGTVDLAFLLADSIQAANLTAELLRIEPMVVVAHPDDPLAGKSRVDYRDLQHRHVLLPKADCGYRMVFEQALVAEKVETAVIIDLNSIEAIKRCVMAGLGLTAIPEIAVLEELDRGSLVRLAWAEDLETAVLMIRHREKWLSRPLEDFMDKVREVVGSG